MPLTRDVQHAPIREHGQIHRLTRRLIEQYGDRISSLHVKDAIVTVPNTEWQQTTIGQGDVDWAAVFEAAQGNVRLYTIEQDPPVEPFSFAAESFEYVDCLVY